MLLFLSVIICILLKKKFNLLFRFSEVFCYRLKLFVNTVVSMILTDINAPRCQNPVKLRALIENGIPVNPKDIELLFIYFMAACRDDPTTFGITEISGCEEVCTSFISLLSALN